MDELERKKAKAIAIAKAKLRLKKSEPEKQNTDPYALENLSGAAIEPLMTLGSGAVGGVAGGLAGLGSYATNALGMTDVDPANVVKDVSGAMTYQPRTSGGQVATEAITYPFQKMEQGADYVGSNVAEMTNPATGAAVKTALMAAPMLFGAKGISGKPTVFPKVQQAMSDTATFIPRKVGQAGNVVSEAVRNRMPGGARRAASETAYEMLGPDAPKVITRLEKGAPTETAGQAAVGSGSFELSALQKAMEQRHPSAYGKIHGAQQAARKADLDSIAGRPIDRVNADKFRSVESKPFYDAARKGNVKGVDSIVSNIDKLVKDNPGNRPLLLELHRIKKGLVDEKGIPRQSAQEVLSTVDGLKTAIANKENAFIKGELTNIKNSLSDLSPMYKEAQKTYARLSQHVNQQQIGKVLSESLEPRLSSAERATSFANAKSNAPLTIKKATGDKSRYGSVEEAMTKPQMGKINKVSKELGRDADLTIQARKGAKAMNERMGTMFDFQKVGILERSIVIMNAILKRVEGKNTAKALDVLSDSMKNPQQMAKLLKEATPKEAAILKNEMIMSKKLMTGSAIGSAAQTGEE